MVYDSTWPDQNLKVKKIQTIEKGDEKLKIRTILEHIYLKGLKDKRPKEKLLQLHQLDVPTSTIYFWFKKFKFGEYYLLDVPRTGRFKGLDFNDILSLIKEDKVISIKKMSLILDRIMSTKSLALK